MKHDLFKIGELTKLLQITPRTIRYYDQLHLLPNVKRSDGNTRLFDNNDIKLIKTIRALQQKELLPLDHIKNKLFTTEVLKDKTICLTDSLSKKECLIPNSFHCISFPKKNNKTQKINLIKNDIIKLNKSGITYFIIFFSNEFTDIYNTVNLSIPKYITLHLYPIHPKNLLTPHIATSMKQL
ncbi:hypothetical protein DID78_01375, partial [Candidatus Marinamargulisbacteria bacterium SCGC AG-343-D04]